MIKDTLSMYAFAYEGKAYGPDGPITDIEGTPLDAKDADTYNQALEAQEINRIKSAPDLLFLYIGQKPMTGDPAKTFDVGKLHYCVQTWLGTWLGWAWLGDRAYTGFGYNTYRRPVTARLFGTLYHGWYMESSGDYCRLRKAKRQDGRYAAKLV